MLFPSYRTERDPLWRREMRERWRRPITLFFVTIYVAGLCWFAYSLYSSLVPAGNVELNMQTRGIGHQLFVSLLGLQIGVWIPCSLLLAAPTISAERERRALIEYLLAGLLPRQIVRAKFASISTFIMVMCAVPLPVLALCFPLGGVEPLELFAGLLLEISIAVLCASLGLLISANSRRVTSAMQQGILLSLGCLFVAAFMLPAFLEAPFAIWLITAGFFIFLTTALIRNCEDVLGMVSHQLEQDEQPLQVQLPPPYSPSLAPPIERPVPQPISRPAQNPLGEDLLENSSWDIWVERVAAWNAIAQREVRVGLRASRLRMALSPDKPSYQYSPWLWALFGMCGALMVAAGQLDPLWHLGVVLVTIGPMISATSGAGAAFTREREQKMLAQLQLCPLLPLEIVVGKIAAMLLLVARSWGGPLLALFLVGLSQGVDVALLTATVIVLSLLFAITLATLLSLLCHHTAIATGGTLGALLVAFVLLPSAPSSLVYFVPWLRTVLTSFPLGTMWIEPMGALLNASNTNTFATPSLSPAEALSRIMCSLVVATMLLVLATTGVWARTSPDDGEAKTRFWERDISRSWR